MLVIVHFVTRKMKIYFTVNIQKSCFVCLLIIHFAIFISKICMSPSQLSTHIPRHKHQQLRATATTKICMSPSRLDVSADCADELEEVAPLQRRRRWGWGFHHPPLLLCLLLFPVLLGLQQAEPSHNTHIYNPCLNLNMCSQNCSLHNKFLLFSTNQTL